MQVGELAHIEVSSFPETSLDVPGRLSHDNAVLHCKLDEVRAGLKTEILHDAVFVKGDGAGRYLQNICSLLH